MVHKLHQRYILFMYLVFTCMPGESYCRRLGSLLLCLCYVFWALINFFVCWFYMSSLGLILFQICALTNIVISREHSGITGGSCHKYHFCRNKTNMFVATKHVFLVVTKTFVATSLLLSWQTQYLSQQTHICRNKTCCDKNDTCGSSH